MDDIRIRDHELTEIANSIASLAELFKDLSTLVIDQGTLLDSVEYNIEQTSVHVADAVKELNIATRYVVHPHVPTRTNRTDRTGIRKIPVDARSYFFFCLLFLD